MSFEQVQVENQKSLVQQSESLDVKKMGLKMIVQTQSLSAYKTTVSKLPKQFLNCQGWHQISWEQTQDWFLDEKAKNLSINLKQLCNFHFLSQDGKIMLTVNRSLVDPALNYENQPKEYDETEEARQYLKTVAESKSYFATDGDLTSMQDIISRQKKILSELGQQKQFNKEIKQSLEKPNLKNINNLNQYAIILCHGGYFALGIFNNKGQCTYHKSDHKYVIRGKQGQRQITKDSNAGSNVKSMGSQIRRDQEKKLQQNVSNILNEAFQILESCDILFLQAPGINYQLLLEAQEPLFKLQNKLRSLCLTAKKATYTEVERIDKALNKIWIVQRHNVDEIDQFF